MSNSESTNKDEPVFPWVAMTFLSLGMLAHSIVFTSPLPYVAYMVYDFGMAKDLDSAGYTAGWITGMFMVGRTLSSIPWGIASDRWGRKPCLVSSMLNVAVFGVFFGFSQSFEMAVAMRFFLGVGNGFMAIAKTVITEIVSCKEHEIRGFGYINGVWGLGMIIGPAIGGLFARPAIQYPSIFSPTGIWGRFPYLLPSLMCSSIALLAGVGLVLFLPETLVKKQDHHLEMIELKKGQFVGYGWSLLKWNQSKYLPLANHDLAEGEDSLQQPQSMGDEKSRIVETHKEADVVVGEDEFSEIAFHEVAGDEELALDKAQQQQQQEKKKKKLPATLHEILHDRNIQVLFVVYMSFCFVVMFVDESFPLWCVSSVSNGGLAWDSAQVGETLASIGLGLVIYQIFFYEYVMKRFFDYDPITTIVKLYHQTSVAIMVVPIFTDWVVRLSLHYNPTINTKTDPWIYAIILVCWLCYRIPATGAFSNLAMMVNASVDPSMRGTMNGLIMTAGSLGNGSGPIVGSTVYALALSLVYGSHQHESDHDAFFLPVDGRIVFILGGLMIILLARVVRLYLVV